METRRSRRRDARVFQRLPTRQMPEVSKAVSDLRAAVSKGNLAKVAALLKGASPTLVDESASLVGVAISRGHLSIATVLLEHGVKPDAVEGGSLLVTALKAGGASLVPPIIAALGAAAPTGPRSCTLRKRALSKPFRHCLRLGPT